MLVIFAFSAHPTVQTSAVDWQDFFVKKLAHIIEYFILGLLIFFSLKNTFTFARSRLLFLTVILTVLYALTDEWHQTFVPGREGRLRDVFFDSTGALLAVLARRFRTPS